MITIFKEPRNAAWGVSLLLIFSILVPQPQAEAARNNNLAIYTDALAPGWGDWSWHTTTNFNATGTVQSGNAAASITYTEAWAGFSLRTATPVNTSPYTAIAFWVYGNSGGNQVDFFTQPTDNGPASPVHSFTIPMGVWTEVIVPLSDLGNPTAIARITWQEASGAGQSPFYLDDLRLIGAEEGTTLLPSTLTVNVAANRKPISPYIYGLNYAKESFAAEIGLPVHRWGGNHTSRYNWQNNGMNHGSDWFFHNNAHYDPYTLQPQTADQWIDQNERTGTASLITVPMIGYAAKNSDPDTCGFSVNKYGPQDAVNSSDNFPDCGNGLSGGNPIASNPLDTSMVTDATFAETWVDHLVATHGAANSGGVRFYATDNEPELWSETHRDVHPDPQTYAELRDKSLAYAAAIKTADPDSQIFGYAAFGWSGYWHSKYDLEAAAQNNYTSYPDYEANGNQYQVAWYLQQMAQYEQNNGIRLLDYLDLHFYPQNGVDLSLAGDATKQALRLRSTRALWDPTYVDESWIGGDDQPEEWRKVRLIPRMHSWVNDNYPATKLAMSEYNWGGLEDINGALAQADLLGIFGREGLDFATLWNYPAPDNNLGYQQFETLPGAYAFRLYRNYDGQGGRFGDVSVNASSSNQAELAIYAAQRNSDSALTLMVINKTGGAIPATVSLAGFTPAPSANVYRYSASNLTAIVRQPDQPVTASGFTANFPANSITLLEIVSGLNLPFDFYLPTITK